MDRETGNGADTDSEAKTPAGGSAASAETQRRLPAGPGRAATDPDARAEAGLPDDGSAEAITQPITGGPATGRLKADGAGHQGRSQDAQAQDAQAHDTQAHDAGAGSAVLRDAGTHEDDGPPSAPGTVPQPPPGGPAEPGRTPESRTPATRTPPTRTPPTGTPATGSPVTRAPDRRSPARLTPARRVLVKAGDQRLAGPARTEQAGATRRSQTSRWEHPPRRLVPVLRPIFPGLATDPRLPMWIARALTATAVGVAVMIWQNWRLGLTAAAAVIILDIIYRSKTTSVIPAAVRVTSAQRRQPAPPGAAAGQGLHRAERACHTGQ